MARPLVLFEFMTHRHSFDRKQAQLCSEVEQVVTLVLGSSTDHRLQQLFVHSVFASKDGSSLTICVIPEGPCSFEQCTELVEALDVARAWVRQQIAAEINRKRTPELRFQLLLGEAGTEL
jgi:ribosome-binding factor A